MFRSRYTPVHGGWLASMVRVHHLRLVHGCRQLGEDGAKRPLPRFLINILMQMCIIYVRSFQ